MYFSNSHERRDLPMPATPTTETSCAFSLVRRGVEQLLHDAQLAVAADERRLEAPPSASSRARPRPRADARQSGTGSALPFSSWQPASSYAIVRLGRTERRLADVHLPGRRDRLDARGRVDEVARDHALALGADA